MYSLATVTCVLNSSERKGVLSMTIVSDAPATVIPSGTWSIDPVWSALEFEIEKLGLFTVKGRVPGFTGTIEGGETPSITGSVDASTITTFDETRDGHVQAPDFFDTERYPELRFESTAVATDGDHLVVRGRPHHQGRHQAHRARGPLRRSRHRPVRERPDRHRARGDGRPHRVRARTGTHRSPAATFCSPNEVVLRADFAAVRAA